MPSVILRGVAPPTSSRTAANRPASCRCRDRALGLPRLTQPPFLGRCRTWFRRRGAASGHVSAARREALNARLPLGLVSRHGEIFAVPEIVLTTHTSPSLVMRTTAVQTRRRKRLLRLRPLLDCGSRVSTRTRRRRGECHEHGDGGRAGSDERGAERDRSPPAALNHGPRPTALGSGCNGERVDAARCLGVSFGVSRRKSSNICRSILAHREFPSLDRQGLVR